MKLATLKTDSGNRVVGVVCDQNKPQYVDLSAVDPSLPGCLKALLAEPDGLAKANAALKKGQSGEVFVEGELQAPLPNPGKVICIGLNYSDHAAESGMDIPSEPICFSKFSSTIIGPDATIELPAASKQVDYEAELVAVIGKRGRTSLLRRR